MSLTQGRKRAFFEGKVKEIGSFLVSETPQNLVKVNIYLW